MPCAIVAVSGQEGVEMADEQPRVVGRGAGGVRWP